MNTTDFSSLALPKQMLHNLRELGFKQMTPVQAQSLSVILENKDVIAQAKTGSGKTAAFGIGLLTKLDVKSLKYSHLYLLLQESWLIRLQKSCAVWQDLRIILKF